MGSSERSEVTQLLRHVASGDRSTVDQLFAAVYQKLRDLAGQFFRREPEGNTLQPTALVHEAYMKLVDQKHVYWQGQTHFFAVAAQAMRRILVDHARRRGAAKRGGKRHRIALDDDLLALDAKSLLMRSAISSPVGIPLVCLCWCRFLKPVSYWTA
jgi:RNA polymerase sigma-70 factor (ECF subfamily)